MSPQSRSLKSFPRASQAAFTLFELLILAGVLASLSLVAFRSMFVFSEQRKLRTAAVELSGYLQVARNAARAENESCTLKLSAAGDSLSATSCKAGSLLKTTKLRSISSSKDLQARFESGATSITFNPEGTITTGDTLLLSSANVPIGVWCVDVQDPLATVRLGWRASDEQTCNYTIEQ